MSASNHNFSFFKLDPKEENAFQSFLKIMESHDEKRIKKLVHALTMYSDKHLLIFSLKSNKFLEFCESKPEIVEVWLESLKKMHAPTFEVKSVDNKFRFSTFRQLLGVLLFDLYQYPVGEISQEEKIKLLNKACEFGLFDAYVEKTQINLTKFKSQNKSKELFREIIEDAFQMGNMFWTPGYIRAALLMYALAIEFSQYKDDRASWVSPLVDALLELIWMGKLLQDHPMSSRMIDVYYEGKGIIAGNNNLFKSWEDVFLKIMEEPVFKQSGCATKNYDDAKKRAEARIKNLNLLPAEKNSLHR